MSGVSHHACTDKHLKCCFRTLSPPDEHFLEDYNVFNTTIHGHDGNEPDDDNEESGSDERTGSIKSTPYFSTVEEVTSDDAIRMEKCIMFSDTLMLLITSLHGSVCKHQDCGRPLVYRKTYVGTCLVVSWGMSGWPCWW